MSHLCNVHHAGEEGIVHPDIIFGGKQQGSPHRDHHQVNDWKGGQVMVRRNKVKREESAPVLIPSMTIGIIKTTLLWSEHRTQARQTTTPSVTIY
jgi:hypothetical protein